MKKNNLLLCIIILFMLVGCARTQKTHEWLSFFLDGMSSYEEWTGQKKSDEAGKAAENEKQSPKEEVEPEQIVEKEEVYPHPPWKNNQCFECHKGEQGMRPKPEPQLCYSCHQDKDFTLEKDGKEREDEKKKLTIHPPLLFKQAPNCTFLCHASPPHVSKVPKLLRNKVEILCVQCHDAPETMRGQNCVLCHDPHASANAKLLRW